MQRFRRLLIIPCGVLLGVLREKIEVSGQIRLDELYLTWTTPSKGFSFPGIYTVLAHLAEQSRAVDFEEFGSG